MKKILPIVIVIMIAVLVLSACGAGPAPSGGAKSAPTEASSKPAAVNPTSAPVVKATQPPADTPQPEATPQGIDLANVSAGLDTLDSYKASFAMTFAGVDSNSKPTTGTLAYTEEFVKNPAAKRTVITGLGTMMGGGTPTPDQSANVMESIEVGGKQYSQIGDICTQITAQSGPTANTMMDPNSIIGGIRGAQMIGPENINGVPAVHYKIDSTGLDVLGYTNSNGDVWVAAPGNYVVKYTFQATSTGKESFFGAAPGQQGTITWDYEVTNINQPIDIKAPENCGGASADIPMMADAQDQAAFGSTSTYSTPSKFEDVVAFYDKEMKAKGWTEAEGGMSAEGSSMKSYTKDNRTVQVMIASDASSGKTTVTILEQKQ